MTISQGDRTTITLPAQSLLTVTSQAGSAGSLIRLANNPGDGDPFSPIEIDASVTTTVGPFATPTRHRLECSAGSISHSVTQADFPSVTSDVERIVKIAQADYDALSPPDPATLYLIVG